MICLSPGIDPKLALKPPIDLDVQFRMDNVLIIPEENNVLTIVNDPIYHPFDNYIQEINATNTIVFRVGILIFIVVQFRTLVFQGNESSLVTYIGFN